MRWYQYIDMATPAEALYQFIIKSIEAELVGKLNFFAKYDRTKKAIQEISELSNRLIVFCFQLCLQNNGSLSAKKRATLLTF